jgi:OmcA/MtrC family decaheme c-type cytochrome
VRFGDYSRVDAGDYVIESTAFTTIQIGTATASKKVAGDACTDCHGTENFRPHNERHSVVFDTDECLSCHDLSGNYAIYIGNRVHAIHSANTDGDWYNVNGGHRDWEEVTYPQTVENCSTCHNSGNMSYYTNPTMMACAGCHVEEGNGVVEHVKGNEGACKVCHGTGKGVDVAAMHPE